VFLVIATLAVYWPARHYAFVAYDDNDYVYQNSTVLKGLTWEGVKWSLADRQANNWHPLTWLSHMLDCQLFGLHAGGPHIVNVAFHGANAVLLFLLLQLLTRGRDLFWRNLFVAALFALHPLRVESVAWISERKDVLSGFFGLLSLLCYAKYAQGTGIPKLSLAYRLSVIFFVCSLLSKPMLVTLPFLMLVLDYWPLQRFGQSSSFSSSSSNSLSFPKLLKEKILFFVIAGAFCLVTMIAQQPGLSGQPLSTVTRFESIPVNYLGYVEKLLWPQNLSFLYLQPDTISISQALLALIILAATSALVIVLRRRCPAMLAGWLWFVITLLPVCGIVVLARLSIADRYTYLAGIGFYWMIVWGAADIAAKSFPTKLKPILLGSAAIIILSVCAFLSRRQLTTWQNTETLYNHALQVDPNNYVAQQNLHIYKFEKAHPDKRPPPPE
jgi:hypothetical protein